MVDVQRSAVLCRLAANPASILVTFQDFESDRWAQLRSVSSSTFFLRLRRDALWFAFFLLPWICQTQPGGKHPDFWMPLKTRRCAPDPFQPDNGFRACRPGRQIPPAVFVPAWRIAETKTGLRHPIERGAAIEINSVPLSAPKAVDRPGLAAVLPSENKLDQVAPLATAALGTGELPGWGGYYVTPPRRKQLIPHVRQATLGNSRATLRQLHKQSLRYRNQANLRAPGRRAHSLE